MRTKKRRCGVVILQGIFFFFESGKCRIQGFANNSRIIFLAKKIVNFFIFLKKFEKCMFNFDS